MKIKEQFLESIESAIPFMVGVGIGVVLIVVTFIVGNFLLRWCK